LLAKAMAVLSQACGEQAWLDLAGGLLDVVRADFTNANLGALTDSSAEVRQSLGLTHAAADPTDNVTPSGWAATVDAAVTVSSLTNNSELRSWAHLLAASLVDLVAQHPRFAGRAASVLTAMLDGPREVAIAAAADSAVTRLVVGMTAPGAVYSFDPESALLHGRIADSGLVYVCRQFTCNAPTADPEQIRALLAIR
jgi:uncharacterized protein YyaL (SSP411 family)